MKTSCNFFNHKNKLTTAFAFLANKKQWSSLCSQNNKSRGFWWHFVKTFSDVLESVHICCKSRKLDYSVAKLITQHCPFFTYSPLRKLPINFPIGLSFSIICSHLLVIYQPPFCHPSVTHLSTIHLPSIQLQFFCQLPTPHSTTFSFFATHPLPI